MSSRGLVRVVLVTVCFDRVLMCVSVRRVICRDRSGGKIVAQETSTIAGFRYCWAADIAIVLLVVDRSSGDVDNSSESYFVGIEGCYCDCDCRENVPTEFPAVSISETSRCEYKIVCLCHGAIEIDKEFITEMLKIFGTQDGFVLVCRKSEFPDPDLQTHGTSNHLCGTRVVNRLDTLR
jgi:hypothetical protein